MEIWEHINLCLLGDYFFNFKGVKKKIKQDPQMYSFFISDTCVLDNHSLW